MIPQRFDFHVDFSTQLISVRDFIESDSMHFCELNLITQNMLSFAKQQTQSNHLCFRDQTSALKISVLQHLILIVLCIYEN